MAIVHYRADSRLSNAMEKAKEWCSDRGINEPECGIATYLSPNVKIIAGHTEVIFFTYVLERVPKCYPDVAVLVRHGNISVTQVTSGDVSERSRRF